MDKFIVFDVVTMVLEVSDPSNTELLFAPDQLMLCFYILELVAPDDAVGIGAACSECVAMTADYGFVS